MRRIIFVVLVITSFLTMPFLTKDSLAVGGPPPPPPMEIPIDGGLSALIVAGVAYAGKKLYQSNDEEI